ncbi:MAG: glycosyltransferase family 4 protein [Candidatus Bathyarchaeota archaeon]|nr:glycosyltransferase family 4 protein [Candidatus Bathyarchaeum sp.]
MKIAVISGRYYPNLFGGGEIYAYDLNNEMERMGHEVSVFTSSFKGTPHSETINNVKVQRTKIVPFTFKNIGIRGINSIVNSVNPQICSDITDFIRQNRPEIVHFNDSWDILGFMPALKVKKQGIPYIVDLHVPWLVCFNGICFRNGKTCLESIAPIRCTNCTVNAFSDLFGRWQKIAKPALWVEIGVFLLVQKISKHFLGEAEKVVVHSRFMKEVIQKKLCVAEKKLEVVPCFVSNSFMKQSEEMSSLRIDEKKKRSDIILSVGRLVPGKGFTRLLKVFSGVIKENRDSKLIIVGEGPQREQLENLAKKLGINNNVTFTGRVSNQRLLDYYTMSKVFVFPATRAEPFGMVNIEAMAYSLPVVASKSGGVTDIVVDNLTGFLVDIDNNGMLTEKILQLLSDDALAEKMGAQGRKRVEEKFTLNIVAKRVLEIYKNTLDRKA